ncbi:MAG: pantoate--beta-alanine ligase [Actinomycetota bacterium]|nr:MAG: pantoate--beta-alanine ligase [Actinomycetota bacterium]
MARTRADLAAALATPAAGRAPRAVVMTMGALHEGHELLLRAARDRVGPAGAVVATIFVNPLQFGPSEDLDRYPRTFEADVTRCAAAGVDVVFAPAASEMYPQGQPTVTVDPGQLGGELEGAVRPGHFSGVLTVVAKLLHLTAPELAFFGEKDYQQLVLIRRMVAALDFPVTVVGVPTVRDPDGLALSSRNRYLDPQQRALAAAIPRAIAAGVAAAAAGDGAQGVEAAATAVLQAAGGIVVDYVQVRGVDLGPAPAVGEGRLVVAARVGATRLLDNASVDLGPPRPGRPGRTGSGRTDRLVQET